MNILQELKDQRDRLNAAIQVLDSGSTSTTISKKRIPGPSYRKPLSAAARRKISLAAKARWAKAKKAGRNRL